MIDIKDKSKCCGCRSCVQVCSKECISFEADNEGFSYPKVNKEQCMDCGLCEKVCPELHIANKRLPISVMAATNKSEETRNRSSSGGFFSLLAESTINNNGVVFGACFDEDWNVVHSYDDTLQGVKKYQRSKYVQSDIRNTFKDVKIFLNDGRKVLFTGTPCQVAALKLFLRKDYENLLAVDFVCHGVPSPMVWKDYLDEIIRPKGDDGKNTVSLSLKDIHRIRDISFRDKSTGWEKFGFSLRYQSASKADKNSVSSSVEDCREVTINERFDVNQYMRTFLDNVDLRPACYLCPFKSGRSCADITIADFWGVQLFHPQFNDDRGTSLVMVFNPKVKPLIDSLDFNYELSNMKNAIRYNSAIVAPHHKHPNRNKFFKYYHNQPSTIKWMHDCEKLGLLDGAYVNILKLYDRIISKIRYII